MSDSFFFSRTDLERGQAQGVLDDALKGADDGELYFEYAQSEAFVFDDNRLKTASFNVDQGFGLRAVCGESTGFAHASELSVTLSNAPATPFRRLNPAMAAKWAPGRPHQRQALSGRNPLGDMSFEAKTKLLADINDYARSKDSRVRQVSASLAGEWSAGKFCARAAMWCAISGRWCASMFLSPPATATDRNRQLWRRRPRRLCAFHHAGRLAGASR